eukprot:6225294-Amphidinium_carterae.1
MGILSVGIQRVVPTKLSTSASAYKGPTQYPSATSAIVESQTRAHPFLLDAGKYSPAHFPGPCIKFTRQHRG